MFEIVGLRKIHSKKTNKDYVQIHYLNEICGNDPETMVGREAGIEMYCLDDVAEGNLEIDGDELAVGRFIRIYKEGVSGFERITLIRVFPSKEELLELQKPLKTDEKK